MRTVDSLAILVALGSSVLPAQDAKLQFEVASVRVAGPAAPGTPGRGGMVQGGPEYLRYERTSFRQLLTDAYGVERDQITGPEWATADFGAFFDISAKIPPGATKDQVATMLQNLLKERFHLELHHVTAEFQGYALVVAKGGPKLKASAGPAEESEHNATASGPVGLQTKKDGFPELYPGRNMGGTFKNGTVRMRFRDYPLTDLLQQFSFALAVHMIDQTGLSGKYDFTLEFTPPENGFIAGMLAATLPLASGKTAPLNKEGTDPAQLDTVPVVSSAMEKQLGLKLQATKIAVDTLVIDHVEKTPTEN